MVSRGVHQLKNIKLYFCDIGGSSLGVRKALQSESFVDFVNKNPHLTVDLLVKRGKHPYMSSTFINGFVKETPLRNKNQYQTVDHFESVNKEFGRKPLRHTDKKVIGSTKSSQGGWVNDDKW